MNELSNGIQMPSLGFGVYQITDQNATKQAVLDAIKVGYRLIDTAAAYGNEREVGAGIHAAIDQGLVTRDELFITSKLWVADVNAERAAQAIQDALGRLQLDYLDLMLIHQPYNDYFAAWRVMEAAYQAGSLKAIGVSNFYDDQITNLAEFNQIKPMVNQIEINPFNQNQERVHYLQSYGVTVEAWAPFGEGRNNLFQNEVLQSIGAQYNKSVAQVILRWLLQRNIIPIAKSTHLERIQQNFSVTDFTLSRDDMQRIQALDQQQSLFFDHRDPDRIKKLAQYRPTY